MYHILRVMQGFQFSVSTVVLELSSDLKNRQVGLGAVIIVVGGEMAATA